MCNSTKKTILVQTKAADWKGSFSVLCCTALRCICPATKTKVVKFWFFSSVWLCYYEGQGFIPVDWHKLELSFDSIFLQASHVKHYCTFLNDSFRTFRRPELQHNDTVVTQLYLEFFRQVPPEHLAPFLCVQSYVRTDGYAGVNSSGQRPE